MPGFGGIDPIQVFISLNFNLQAERFYLPLTVMVIA
jgi:hypothetical protein